MLLSSEEDASVLWIGWRAMSVMALRWDWRVCVAAPGSQVWGSLVVGLEGVSWVWRVDSWDSRSIIW